VLEKSSKKSSLGSLCLPGNSQDPGGLMYRVSIFSESTILMGPLLIKCESLLIFRRCLPLPGLSVLLGNKAESQPPQTSYLEKKKKNSSINNINIKMT
jgi:hypothetical protein